MSHQAIEAATDALETVVVARGRTVNNGLRTFGPGEQLTVPQSEATYLRTAGFVCDPNAEQPLILSADWQMARQNPAAVGLATRFEW